MTPSFEAEVDYNGNYEIRRNELLVAELTWCAHPIDRTRFGWLLHIIDPSDRQMIAVLRVGDIEAQDALWSREKRLDAWAAHADAAREALRADALSEALDLLNGFA